LAHDFAHKAIHRRNAILQLATTEDLGTVDIPGSQVDPGTPAKVLVFPLSWDGSAQQAKSVVSGGGPECWSFRRQR
jgi:hypothetical protein